MLHIFSNIAYLIAGIYTGEPVLMLSMTSLAIGSFMGHWRGGLWWRADWIGMYLVFASLILHNVGLPEAFYIIYGAIVALGLYYKKDDYVLIGILWALSVLSAYFANVEVVAPILLFAVALAIRQISLKIGTTTYDIVHSTWHVLTAIGFVLLAR